MRPFPPRYDSYSFNIAHFKKGNASCKLYYHEMAELTTLVRSMYKCKSTAIKLSVIVRNINDDRNFINCTAANKQYIGGPLYVEDYPRSKELRGLQEQQFSS
ncbi:hypothetical protein Trydic_g22534 [Trypoxylus dichotomus]